MNRYNLTSDCPQHTYGAFIIVKTEKKARKHLLIIGPLPEPKGGVSVHITRLAKLVQDDFDIRFVDESPIRKPEIFNVRSKNISKYLILLAWADIVHIHSGVSSLRFIHVVAARLMLKRVIVTIHSFPFQKGYQRAINRALIALTSHTILVSEKIEETLKPHAFTILPAFIPPNISKEPPLPDPINDWLTLQEQTKRIVISANAFRIEFYNGQDLYGIDLAIKMLDELVNVQKKHISLIFVLATLAKSQAFYDEYQKLIAEAGLSKNMLLVQADLSFVKLIERSDIIVRPTCTDGDALTVREALYLGRPVIASDVVNRPKGTILFRNRDYISMANSVISVIDSPRKPSPPQQTIDEHRGYYTKVYHDN